MAIGLLAASAGFAAPLSDRDGDGIADRKDLCPASPRGAAPIAEGCSALEIVLAPELLVDPVRSLLDEPGSLSFTEAAEVLGAGDVCRAADLFEAAAAELDAVELLAVKKAHGAAGYARAACGQVVGSGRLRGPVAGVDDASRTFRFADDQVVGIAAKSLPAGLMAGRRIDGRGLRFADGTAVLTSLRGDLPAAAMEVKAPPCLKVKVAPFQRFPPFKDNNLPYRLRETGGYLKNEVLQLERTHRLAAESTGCSPTGTFGVFYHYTMKIDVTQGANTWTIASDLQDEETPVALPNLVSGQSATVTATTFKTTCSVGCNSPQPQGTEIFQLVARPWGSYATASYNKTVFNVGGNLSINDYEPAQITTVTLSSNLPNASPAPIFYATGYKLNSENNPPNVPTGVLVMDKFGVYEVDDLFDETAPLRSEFAIKGIDHVAGLNWPTLTGWNAETGDSFEYSGTLPKIVRDRIVDCSGALDNYYLLPYKGEYPEWNVTKGNFDDPTSGYTGVHQFALSFSTPSGGDVYAARGGVVAALEEGQSSNASELVNSSSVGNWVSIRHEDGTYGFYFHLAKNGVLVEVGDRVYRYSHIADAGGSKLVFEIGNQCPPHQCPGLSSSYQTVKGLYAFTPGLHLGFGWVPGQPVSCKVPRVGQVIF